LRKEGGAVKAGGGKGKGETKDKGRREEGQRNSLWRSRRRDHHRLGTMSIARAMWEAAFMPSGHTMEEEEDLSTRGGIVSKRRQSTALRFPKVCVALSRNPS
jgi:hypothetical protein